VATVFFSYSHADEALRDQLEKQLSILKRQGVIETWHDRRIVAGEEFDKAIASHVEIDDIILLLVSSDFLASDYCYDREMLRAMERHGQGAATVIPVILRPCDWMSTPFGKLQAVPTNGRPVTLWPDRDEAFLEVARAIRAVTTRQNERAPPAPLMATATSSEPMALIARGAREMMLRSSNMRLAKSFTERDRDAFRLEAFEFIAKFFEGSLSELGKRNPGYEGVFRRVDVNRFFASVYRDGKAVARCTIFMGGGALIGNGIAYVAQETTESNTLGDQLSIESDDQSIYLRSWGMQSGRGNRDEKLTFEGGAEYLWSNLISRLQSN